MGDGFGRASREGSDSRLRSAKLGGMKNWLLGLGVFSVTKGCAVGVEEEDDWEVSGETDVNSVEQAATAAERAAINRKRASNDWLGDATSGFNDYSGGVVRIYESGSILHSDAVNRAHTMVKTSIDFGHGSESRASAFPTKTATHRWRTATYPSVEDRRVSFSPRRRT